MEATPSRDNDFGASNLQRMFPYIVAGFSFNTCLYLSVYFTLPHTSWDPAPLPEFCKLDRNNGTITSCSRSDLLAFQVVSFLNLSFLGLTGFSAFFITRRATSSLPQTPQARILGNVTPKSRGISPINTNGQGVVMLREADYINTAIIVFQGWDFIASMFVEEHCTLIMMTHHFLAFICGFYSLKYGLVPYAAVYFGGVSEFSSIFLSIVDIFKYFPPSSLAPENPYLAEMLSKIEFFSGVMFATTFFLFRIVGWVYCSYLLMSDSLHVHRSRLIEQYCPGSTWFICYLCSMCVLLGLLQVFWFGQIVEKVGEVLSGDN